MHRSSIVSDDVVELILDDHATFRRLFGRIFERPAVHDLEELWFQVMPLLAAHAIAEEDTFYPAMLKAASDVDQVKDAIHDHNEIRDALAQANRYAVGSDEWWSAVTMARGANDDHMSEEEEGPLPLARERMPLDQRVYLGQAFLRIRDAYPSGVTRAENVDKDPSAYVREHR